MMLTRPESLALLACMTATTWLLVRAAIHNAQHVINDAANDVARKWTEIAEDFADDELELLRRINDEMAGVEAAVLRDWQDMPYDVDADGGI